MHVHIELSAEFVKKRLFVDIKLVVGIKSKTNVSKSTHRIGLFNNFIDLAYNGILLSPVFTLLELIKQIIKLF